MDDRLTRVVICNEKKIADFDENINDSSEVGSMVDGILDKLNLAEPSNSSVKSEAGGDMDDRLQQLQEALARGNESNDDENVSISRYPISIFGLVGGVWLGDCVNREHSRPLTSKGFGAAKTKHRKFFKAGPGMNDGFAEWTTGVQKVAMTYQWDYGKSLRQKMSYGNAMGVACNLPVSSAGEIILNEMSETAKSLDERMIYIDFDVGSYAAFVIGSVLVKVPRTLSFSFSTGKMKNFYTEFAVFQKRNVEDQTNQKEDDSGKPVELFCSRLTRLYGTNGKLIQASSSFFELDRLNS
mmetsp:Transcript_3956/g.6043  ORF Transcript_3956/g.6043 Transcript_3956/m.6043 type:complete len:297 (+) Transcript_3956:878-1768(+)